MIRTPKTFDNILFDLDGTISDSYEGITKSVVYALRKMGIDPPASRETLRVFIGPSLWESFSVHYGLDEAGAARAVSYYREYYSVSGMLDCTIYDGVRELLKSLRALGKKIILATSKPEPAALQILRHFGLLTLFDFAAGASVDTSRVKKADVIAYALRAAGISADRSVMVGDRLHDAEGARENGMPCIGVLYGYGDRAELTAAGAEFLAATPRDVLEIIKSART